MANHSTFKDLNPFERLGLHPTFDVDATALDEAYFARQALTHPDRFVCHSKAEREAASEQAALLNQAYEALKNPVSRAKALLALRGIETPEEGKAIQAPHILEEMMDFRETLSRVISLVDLDRLNSRVYGHFQEVMDSFRCAIRQDQNQELPDLFLRLTYLSKLRGDIKTRQQQSSPKVL